MNPASTEPINSGVYQNAFNENGEEEGSDLHKLLRGRLKTLRNGAGRKELLDCVATIDDPPVISVEQLDQQPYLLAIPTRKVRFSPAKPRPL